jgi:hypothetical protein
MTHLQQGTSGMMIRRSMIALCVVVIGSQNLFAEIEALQGKQYNLTRQHGPWMIMVASIRDVEEERRIDGLSARQAADQLVHSLRSKGIPAYTYSRDTVTASLAGSTSFSERTYVAQHGYISVLAGNFPSNSDKTAERVLKYVKNFRPKFLEDEKSGGLFARTPGRPEPLSKAFLTVNPLLSPKEIKDRTVDPLLKQLNADMEFSLLKNEGKYTLVVATFRGSSIMQVGHQVDTSAMKRFENNFGSNLDQSATEAWALTEFLRNAKQHGYDKNYEAWVLHDRHQSVVTIGSFDSPDDPRMRTLASQFRSKMKRHPETGQQVEVAETFTIPRQPAPGQLPDKLWIFDGTPRRKTVPTVR